MGLEKTIIIFVYDVVASVYFQPSSKILLFSIVFPVFIIIILN